jgi:hypothetical protein
LNPAAFTKKPLSQKEKKTLQKQQAKAKASAPAPSPSPPTPSGNANSGGGGDKKEIAKKAEAVFSGKTNGGAAGDKSSDKAAATGVPPTGDPSAEKKRQTQWEQTKAMSTANENFKAGK